MAKRPANQASQPVPVDGPTGTGELAPVDVPLRSWDVRSRGRQLCRVEAANSTEAIAEAVRQYRITRPEKFALEALPV